MIQHQPRQLYLPDTFMKLFFLTVIVSCVSLLASPYYAFSIAPALVIMFLLILSQKPQLGFFLILFFVPFDAYRGLLESYRFLTVSKLAGFLTFIIVLCYLLLKQRLRLNINSNLWPWFALFFLVYIVSSMMSDYQLTSYDNLRSLLTAYIFFMMALILVPEKSFRTTLPIILVVSISLSALFSIAGYVLGIENLTTSLAANTVDRASGTSGDANQFAAMLIFNVPLLAYWIFSSRGWKVKATAVCLLILNLSAVMITYSRGGSIILIAVLALVALQQSKKFRPRYAGFVTGIIAVAIITAAVVVPNSYWNRLYSLSSSADTSIGRRTAYLHVGWDAFKEDPILGAGPGTFIKLYGESMESRRFRSKDGSYERYAHNTYVEVLTGTGLLGLAVFIAIIAVTLRNFLLARKYFALRGEENMVSLTGAYGISFLSLIMYFMFLSALNYKYFWLSLAISQIALRLARNKSLDESPETI